MIKESEFRGLKALIIENSLLKITVIPNLGGKIASFVQKDKNFEFYFQHKKDIFDLPEIYDNFGEFDSSGFDDCFPSVDESEVSVNGKKIRYPDHGEVWSRRMSCEVDGEAVYLSFISGILNYHYQKKISVENNIISLDYSISNTGNEPFPSIWTMHGLLSYETGMEIFFPAGAASVVNVQKSTRLGNPGRIYSYPDAVTDDGSIYRLNRTGSVSSPETEKFYVNEPLTEGKCGVYYPSSDISYTLYYDHQKLPYLGLWITEGGFRGDYNLALEPSNGFYDRIDIAEKNGKIKILNPGEQIEFNIMIEVTDGKEIYKTV